MRTDSRSTAPKGHLGPVKLRHSNLCGRRYKEGSVHMCIQSRNAYVCKNVLVHTHLCVYTCESTCGLCALMQRSLFLQDGMCVCMCKWEVVSPFGGEHLCMAGCKHRKDCALQLAPRKLSI